MPRVYAYVKRPNAPTQAARIVREQGDRAWKWREKVMRLDHTFRDARTAIEGLSVAYRERFLDRPEAKALVESLIPGDVVLIGDHKRAFRSAADAMMTMGYFANRKCRLVLCNLSIDNESNRWQHLLRAAAEGEEHLRLVRREPRGGTRPQTADWQPRRRTRTKAQATTLRRRAIARLVSLYRTNGRPWQQIADAINGFIASRRDGNDGHAPAPAGSRNKRKPESPLWHQWNLLALAKRHRRRVGRRS